MSVVVWFSAKLGVRIFKPAINIKSLDDTMGTTMMINFELNTRNLENTLQNLTF